jgi:hypothetical protein
MNAASRLLRAAGLLAVCLLTAAPLSVKAADLEVRLQPSRSNAGGPVYDNFQVVFLEDGIPSQKLIVTPAVTAANSYELIGKKGNDLTELEIASVRAIPKGGPALRLEIIPKEKPDVSKFDAFQLRPKNPAIWQFTDGSAFHYANHGSFAVLDTKIIKENATYYRRFSGFQNHVDTSHKFDAGVVSLELHYQARTSEESTQSDAYLFLFNAKGDFVFPQKEKASFTNNLNADLEFVYSHLPDTFKSSAPAGSLVDPHHIPPPENRWEPFWDLGISAKYESDQNFENVNFLAGVVAHIILRNPITDSLQRGILLNEPLFLNPKRIVIATIAPLITLRYDYVSNVKEGQPLDTGKNRFTGALFYRLPLAREIDILKSTGLTKQVFDSDFIAELEAVYDFDKKKYANNSKLTLEIVPHTDVEHQPALILTYAQGKTTPTFQHFDAFLAGLKVPF